jgi:hypothetical protein
MHSLKLYKLTLTTFSQNFSDFVVWTTPSVESKVYVKSMEFKKKKSLNNLTQRLGKTELVNEKFRG